MRRLLELTLPRADSPASSWRTSSVECGVVAPRVLCATDADPRFQEGRPPSMLTAAFPVYAMTRIVLRFQRDAQRAQRIYDAGLAHTGGTGDDAPSLCMSCRCLPSSKHPMSVGWSLEGRVAALPGGKNGGHFPAWQRRHIRRRSSTCGVCSYSWRPRRTSTTWWWRKAGA